MNIEATLEKVLSTICDPVLNKPLSQLNFKSVVSLEDNQLSINLCAGFPIGHWKETLAAQIEQATQAELPTHKVTVFIDSYIKAHRTQLPGKGLRGIKNTIAIASGKGGVGKSTVAVNLAITLARMGARVGILDADIYGPSIPLMLGPTNPIQIQGEHYVPAAVHGIHAMSIGYLTQGDSALIWRGPMLAKSLIQLLDKTDWDELDYLFIDLPPGTGDIQLSLVQKIPLTGAIVVTTPQNVATLDAKKAIDLFEKTNIHVFGLIENMTTHRCAKCGHEEAIFGQGGASALCESHQYPILGQLPLDLKIGEDCDKGIPTAAQNNEALNASFVEAAFKTALAVQQQPLNYAEKFPPIRVE